jgi:hypothetical protein
MGFLSGLFGGDAGKATMNAATENKKLFQGYKTEGLGYIGAGEDKANAAIERSAAMYDPIIARATAGANLYDDALGINGAGGNQRAVDAFQVGPGYQFALNQGQQAAQRAASAGGMLASGNTLAALTRFGQGLANQEYDGWLDRLSPYADREAQGIGAKAGTIGQLAPIAMNASGQRVDLTGAVVQGIAGANNQFAQGQEANAASKAAGFGSLLGLGGKILGGFF